jgi:hypothetical protein
VTPRLLLILALAVFAQAAVVGHSLAAPQVPNVPDVDLPPLPKPDEKAHFALTVSGDQSASVKYTFEVPSPDCPLKSEGEVSEGWHFERGKAVVIEFRRYGKNVFISRRGREIGDLAFGTTGTLSRGSKGTVTDCRGTLPVGQSPVCDKDFNVHRDFRISYQGGVIAVEASFNKGIPRNPAEACGIDIDVLSPEFPTVIKTRAALPVKRVFGAKKGIKLKLKGSWPRPVPPAYTRIDEYFGAAEVELTLTRLGPN